MQILCGLQVVFFLFNCQTPVVERDFWKTDFAAGGLACAWMTCYNLVFDTFKKKKALQPLKTRACSALWSVHEI